MIWNCPPHCMCEILPPDELKSWIIKHPIIEFSGSMHNHVGSGNMHNNHILDIWLSILQTGQKYIIFLQNGYFHFSFSFGVTKSLLCPRMSPAPENCFPKKRSYIIFERRQTNILQFQNNKKAPWIRGFLDTRQDQQPVPVLRHPLHLLHLKLPGWSWWSNPKPF